MTQRRTRCSNGHDLTAPGATYGNRWCAECRRVSQKGLDHRRRDRNSTGRIAEIFTDREQAIAEMHRQIALEDAPKWVKRGTREDQDAWLAAMREERLRHR